MSLYVDCTLTPELRDSLTVAGVDFAEVTIGSAVYHRHGITFPEGHATGVAEVLNLVVDRQGDLRYVEIPGGSTRMPNLYHLPVVPLPSSDKPVVYTGNSSSWAQSVYAEHYDELKLGMIAGNFGQDDSEYRQIPGVLFVNHNSNPDVMRCDTVHDEDFSARFMPPNSIRRHYLRIRAGDRRTIALFRGDSTGGTLWVLVKLQRHAKCNEILGYLLSVLAHHLHPELGPAPTYAEHEEQEARRHYLEQIREILEGEQSSIDDRVEEADREVREAREQFMQTLRGANAAQMRRNVLAGADEETLLAEFVAQIDRELDAVKASPDFTSLELKGDTLRAETRPITIVYENSAYEFGRYLITVDQEQLDIKSLDGVHAENDAPTCHPHITEYGETVCLGSISESVTKLQAGMQFGLLLPLLVHYLETSYNPADSYSLIDDFVNVTQHDLEVQS